MSELKIFNEQEPQRVLVQTKLASEMASQLKRAGVRFEQWHTSVTLKPGDSTDLVLAAYRQDIDRLIADEGYQTVDVVSLNSNAPNKSELRKKFLSEHTHGEDEVRFFVGGEGLFTLHIGTQVFEVLCQQGDLISVPARTPHWFDMGPNPNFIAIRLFNNPEGWVAHYTGNDLADRFSRLTN
jgi:1,2-dihydroxy-3-keto-5-methylthiopentene dioxygenase